MAYADQELSGNRIIALIIVALIHIGLGYALVTGLAYSAFQEAVERVTMVDVEDEPPPEEEPPPPEPEPDTSPPPIVAPPPPINVSVRPPPIRTQVEIPPPAPIQTRVPPPAPVATRQAPPPPPPTPPPPSKARGASTLNEGRWAGQIQANYPSRARRTGTEGDVGVSVTVSAAGRATGCRVTRSSGDSSLDSAACQGMERYARFNPALDAAGNATSDSYNTTIRYQLN